MLKELNNIIFYSQLKKKEREDSFANYLCLQFRDSSPQEKSYGPDFVPD
jgi:hypothetical protein